MSIDELVAWCEDNLAIPDSEMLDEPFVVDYESFFQENFDKNDPNIPENYESGDLFR